MQFCNECGNILLPQKAKNTLYCKVCDKSFAVKESEELKEYKKATKKKMSQRKKNKQRALRTAIVLEETKKPAISRDEREALEDLFEAPEI
jgi:DNA-directed RNA polymerase subunit M/transcription elongation factor TFIIS